MTYSQCSGNREARERTLQSVAEGCDVGVLEVCLSGLCGVLVLAFGFRRMVWYVRGPSMGETIPSGSFLLLDPLPARWRRPRVGDIVVVRMTLRGGNGYIVKRIASVSRPPRSQRNEAQEDRYVSSVFLKGDDEARSRDSRHFGAVPTSSVRGYVFAILRRPGVSVRSSCSTRTEGPRCGCAHALPAWGRPR